MYQFYTVEIKKTHSGDFEHDVKWFWDEDINKAQRKAESHFHEILADAAVSGDTYSEHSAIIFSEEGFPIDNKCYKHDAPAATEEPTEA